MFLARKYRGGFLILLLAAASPAWPAPALQLPPPAETALIEHTPVTEFMAGAPLEFRARVRTPAAWVSVFYRFEGIDHFQARPMEKAADGSYVLEFDTSLLPSPSFNYYLAAGIEAGIATFPVSGQDQPLRVVGRGETATPEIPAGIPPPQEETAPAAPPAAAIPFPVQVSGSGQAALAEKTPIPGAEKFPAAGNIRIFFAPPQSGAFGLNIDSNFSYSNTPREGEKPVDLSNMNASLTLSGHTLRAGDLSVQESEYSVQGLGRRGLEYAFDNQKAYLHLFTVSSQQARGFKGFGLPRPEVALFGGAAGYRILGEALFLKAIYLTGKDTPSAGVGVGMPDFLQGFGGRKGQVLAVAEETRLWSGRFSFRAEFAHSRHDADLQDTEGPAGANALTLGTNLAAGALTAAVTYRHVGRGFNSIGLQSLANDRSGLEAMVGLAAGPFSLTGSFLQQRDNVGDDPDSATTRNLDGNLNLSLALSPKAQLAFGCRVGRQKTTPGAEPSALQDSATNELSGSFNLMVGSSSSFTLSVISSRLASQANPETAGSTLTLSLGGSHSGERLNFSPTLGLTTTKGELSGARSDTLSAMVVAEYFFWPQALSAFLTGSLSLSDPAEGSVSTNLDLLSGFNVYLGQILKVGSLLLSLKGSYGAMESPGLRTVNWRVFAQCDVSF